jgi:hypothetical protein
MDLVFNRGFLSSSRRDLEERGWPGQVPMSWSRTGVEGDDVAISPTTTDEELEFFRARLAVAGLDPAVATLLPELPQ